MEALVENSVARHHPFKDIFVSFNHGSKVGNGIGRLFYSIQGIE